MFTKSRIFILILTFLCFVVWLTADLFKTPSTFTPKPETTKALEIINPELDQDTLSKIDDLPTTLPPFNPKSTPKPSPVVRSSASPSPSPQPSSATISPSPRPSQSLPSSSTSP